MLGFLHKRRGIFTGGGIVGTAAAVAYGIGQFARHSTLPAADEVATTTPTFTFIPPSAVLFAPSDVCYPSNSTVHNYTTGHDQCEVPNSFYDIGAPRFDPVLLFLLLIVEGTIFHAFVAVYNALLTPKHYGFICNGYSVAGTLYGVLNGLEEFTGVATISALPTYAFYSACLLGTMACSLLSAYSNGGKVSEVAKARAKLDWIIRKRNKTIDSLVTAVKDLKSRYDNLLQILGHTQAELNKMHRDVDGKASKIAELEKKLAEASNKLDEHPKAMKKSQDELKKANNELAEKSAALVTLQRQLADVETESAEGVTKIKTLDGELTFANIESAMQATKIEEINDEVSSKGNTISQQSSKITDLNGKLESANAKSNERSTKVEELQHEVASKNTTISKQSSKITGLEDNIKTAIAKSNEQSDEIKELQDQMSSQNTTISEDATKMKELQDEVDARGSTISKQSGNIERLTGEIVSKDTVISKRSATIRSLRIKLNKTTTALQKITVGLRKTVRNREHDLKSASERHEVFQQQISDSHVVCADLKKQVDALAESNHDMRMMAGFDQIEADLELMAAHEGCSKLQSRCAELQGEIDDKLISGNALDWSKVFYASRKEVIDYKDNDANKGTTKPSDSESSAKCESLAMTFPVPPGFNFDANSKSQVHFHRQSIREPSAMELKFSTDISRPLVAGKWPLPLPKLDTQAEPEKSQPVRQPPSDECPAPLNNTHTPGVQTSLEVSSEPEIRPEVPPPAMHMFLGHPDPRAFKPMPRHSKAKQTEHPPPNFDDWAPELPTYVPNREKTQKLKLDASCEPVEELIVSGEAQLAKKPRAGHFEKSSSAVELVVPRDKSASDSVKEDRRDESVPSALATSSKTAGEPLPSRFDPTVGNGQISTSESNSSKCDAEAASLSDQTPSTSSSPVGQSASIEPPSPTTTDISSLTSPDATSTSNSASTDNAPPPDDACWVTTNLTCRYYNNGCVGHPENYHPVKHHWVKQMPPGVKRFGTNDKDAESKRKGKAKGKKICTECYVWRKDVLGEQDG